jgi:hypothetical protein
MHEKTLKPLGNRKAVFGSLAIVCFCVGTSLYLYGLHLAQENVSTWAMVIGVTQGQADDWWTKSIGGATYAMFAGLILWVLGLVFAVTGLTRAERPRWPAIVGLALCVFPFVLCLVLWGYGAVGHG